MLVIGANVTHISAFAMFERLYRSRTIHRKGYTWKEISELYRMESDTRKLLLACVIDI